MKPARILLPALFAVLFAGACRRNVQPVLADRSFDTVILCGVVPCDVSCRFRTIENAGQNEALAAIENANINYFFALEDFVGSPEDAARVLLDRFAAECACDTLYNPAMRYSLNISSDAVLLDTLLVCKIRRESYTGGAHGAYSTRYHNYGVAGGYELSLCDLLSEEEFARLTGQIRRKLCDQYGVADEEQLAQLGFFPSMIAPTENFEITPSGITFHYDPYEIACYAIGEVEVPFTREELGVK